MGRNGGRMDLHPPRLTLPSLPLECERAEATGYDGVLRLPAGPRFPEQVTRGVLPEGLGLSPSRTYPPRFHGSRTGRVLRGEGMSSRISKERDETRVGDGSSSVTGDRLRGDEEGAVLWFRGCPEVGPVFSPPVVVSRVTPGPSGSIPHTRVPSERKRSRLRGDGVGLDRLSLSKGLEGGGEEGFVSGVPIPRLSSKWGFKGPFLFLLYSRRPVVVPDCNLSSFLKGYGFLGRRFLTVSKEGKVRETGSPVASGNPITPTSARMGTPQDRGSRSVSKIPFLSRGGAVSVVSSLLPPPPIRSRVLFQSKTRPRFQ